MGLVIEEFYEEFRYFRFEVDCRVEIDSVLG